MSALSENEILSRHKQALGEAHQAAQMLGKNADPEYLEPRSRHYGNLKRALNNLEGSCRQMAHWRGDARWLRLGVIYARAMRGAQAKFVGQRWAWFNELMSLFVLGQVRLDELQNMKTGRLSSSPILPSNPSAWLHLPDHKVPMPPMPPGHLIN